MTPAEIIDEMRDLAVSAVEGDREMAHIRADELLLETIRELNSTHAWYPDEVEAVIEAWMTVPKWYA